MHACMRVGKLSLSLYSSNEGYLQECANVCKKPARLQEARHVCKNYIAMSKNHAS